MSYDSNVMQAALRRLQAKRRDREAAFNTRRNEIYARIPRTLVIDQQLRLTIPQVLAAAARKGENTAAALDGLRRKNLSLQRESEGLLLQNGYPADALTETPECSVCGDSGWLKDGTMCSCLKKLCSEEQSRELSSLLDLKGQTFDTFRLDLYDETPNQRGISDRTVMTIVRDMAKDYADHFPSSDVRNLYLSGGPGLGKTFLSAAIAGEVSTKGYSVVYDTAASIFAQCEAQKFTRDPEATDNTRRYYQCDLLIIDDLGSEMVTNFTRSALYDIINSRLNSSRCTVISSNLSTADLPRIYPAAVCSRISGEYVSLGFVGSDLRQRLRWENAAGVIK